MNEVVGVEGVADKEAGDVELCVLVVLPLVDLAAGAYQLRQIYYVVSARLTGRK